MAILATGLLAGFLDGLSAVVNHLIQGGRAPQRIFKYIASGVLGPSALAGGTMMVVTGVCFHMAIAMIWTIIFFLVAQRLPLLRRNAVAVAVGYGLFVWCVMNLVVLPLSAGPPRTTAMPMVVLVTGLLVHMFGIGLPIALAARSAARER